MQDLIITPAEYLRRMASNPTPSIDESESLVAKYEEMCRLDWYGVSKEWHEAASAAYSFLFESSQTNERIAAAAFHERMRRDSNEGQLTQEFNSRSGLSDLNFGVPELDQLASGLIQASSQEDSDVDNIELGDELSEESFIRGPNDDLWTKHLLLTAGINVDIDQVGGRFAIAQSSDFITLSIDDEVVHDGNIQFRLRKEDQTETVFSQLRFKDTLSCFLFGAGSMYERFQLYCSWTFGEYLSLFLDGRISVATLRENLLNQGYWPRGESEPDSALDRKVQGELSSGWMYAKLEKIGWDWNPLASELLSYLKYEPIFYSWIFYDIRDEALATFLQSLPQQI